MFNSLVKPVKTLDSNIDEDDALIAEIDDNLSQWSPIPLAIREAQALESDLDQVELFIAVARKHGVDKALESYVDADGTLSSLIAAKAPLHTLDVEKIAGALESLVAEHDGEPAQEADVEGAELSAAWVEAIMALLSGVSSILTGVRITAIWRKRIRRYSDSVEQKTWSAEKAADTTITAPTAKALADEIAAAERVESALKSIWANAMPATKAEFDKWVADVSGVVAQFQPVYGISLEKKTLFTRRPKVTIEKRDPRFDVNDDLITKLGYTDSSMDDLFAATERLLKSINNAEKQIIAIHRSLDRTKAQIKTKPSFFARFKSRRNLKKAAKLSARLTEILVVQCVLRKTVPTTVSTAGKLRKVYIKRKN